jgi:hypothetical protein
MSTETLIIYIAVLLLGAVARYIFEHHRRRIVRLEQEIGRRIMAEINAEQPHRMNDATLASVTGEEPLAENERNAIKARLDLFHTLVERHGGMTERLTNRFKGWQNVAQTNFERLAVRVSRLEAAVGAEPAAGFQTPEPVTMLPMKDPLIETGTTPINNTPLLKKAEDKPE